MKKSYSYAQVRIPDHPKANSNGYVREHILRAEKALGKALPERAVVHHSNGYFCKESLVICEDQAYHMLLHARAKALKECGHAHFTKCNFCGEYGPPEHMHHYVCKERRRHHYHKACNAAYQRDRRKTSKGKGE